MTIVQLFNLVATACMLPEGLEEELLYKNYDPEKASNYRGIALVKVLAKLLSRRLSTFAEELGDLNRGPGRVIDSEGGV